MRGVIAFCSEWKKKASRPKNSYPSPVLHVGSLPGSVVSCIQVPCAQKHRSERGTQGKPAQSYDHPSQGSVKRAMDSKKPYSPPRMIHYPPHQVAEFNTHLS